MYQYYDNHYSTDDGGYLVQRHDGIKIAVFVSEAEADFFCSIANIACERLDHSGFSEIDIETMINDPVI